MTGAALWRYVQYLKRSGLDARSYEVAFWSRIAIALRRAADVRAGRALRAGPIALGSGAGSRMLAGLGIGLDVVPGQPDALGRRRGLEPECRCVVAWLPTVLLGIATFVVLRRTR